MRISSGIGVLFLAGLIHCVQGLIAPSATATEPSAVSSDVAKDLPESETGKGEPWQRQLTKDVAFLCSDALRGRSVTDDTIHVAANYIADRFNQLGLETNLFSGTPLQPVLIPIGNRIGPEQHNRLAITTRDLQGTEVETLAVLGQSVNPLAIGVRESTVRGRVVFVGYGITAPEYQYDDYAGLDVRGAIVAMLRKEPGNSDPSSRFDGTRTTSHAYFSTKVANAMNHGATAVIIVNDRASIDESVEKLDTSLSSERRRRARMVEQFDELPEEAIKSRNSLQQRLASIDTVIAGYEKSRQAIADGLLGVSEAGERADSATTIPVLAMSRTLFDSMLKSQTRMTIDDIESRLDTQQRPLSFAIDDASVELQVSLFSSDETTNNVLGVLLGKGALANETVIVGAHYDHVGMGGYGSLAPGTIEIHNGADDNASGVATMMAAIPLMQERLLAFDTHRRVLFIAFTGEERGLLGSVEYCRRPRFSLSSTVAMVNLDMVGRLRDNELTVYGTGSGDTLDQTLEQANFKHRFDLYKVVSGYGPSDHQSFYEAGVPVLFFFTGLHNDYHRPSDDIEKINFEGMFRVTEMVSDVATQLTIAASRPFRVETDSGVAIRRQLTTFLGVSLSNRKDHVVLSGIAEGGPAMLSGLQIGDRLERLGKNRIQSATDVLETLRDFSPGDSVDVGVYRSGHRLERRVRLQARP